jgi:APA family basic amino acid/polyamine antiporter
MIPVFLGDISLVAHATVFGVLISFFLVNLSLIFLRKRKPELERPFKLRPNMGWIPIIALLGAIVCFGLLFTFDLIIIIIEGIIVLIGIIVFYAIKAKIETKTSRFKELKEKRE